jgi:hypothetical protein
MFVGIDWATDAHEVCAVDASGKVCHRARIPLPGRPGPAGRPPHRWAAEGELRVQAGWTGRLQT